MSERRLINTGPRSIATFGYPSDLKFFRCAFAAAYGFFQIVIEEHFQLNSCPEESAYCGAYRIKRTICLRLYCLGKNNYQLTLRLVNYFQENRNMYLYFRLLLGMDIAFAVWQVAFIVCIYLIGDENTYICTRQWTASKSVQMKDYFLFSANPVSKSMLS